MIAYIICMVHKKAFNFIEILDIYINDESRAIEVRDSLNKDRPKYAQVMIRVQKVKK